MVTNEQSAGLLDVGPRDIREALADIRALEVRLAEQKQFNELLADELKQARRAAQSDAEPVRAFAKAVLHGDDEHKAWLLEAAEAFIANKPLPSPRGKGTAPSAQSDAEPETYGDQLRRVMKRQAMQSDAEPILWRWRLKGDSAWSFWDDDGPWPDDAEVEPLYAAPPRPDASADVYNPERDGLLEPPEIDASAGLIEAAEWLERAATDYEGHGPWEQGVRHGLSIAVKYLRVRAADRSAK